MAHRGMGESSVRHDDFDAREGRFLPTAPFFERKDVLRLLATDFFGQ